MRDKSIAEVLVMGTIKVDSFRGLSSAKELNFTHTHTLNSSLTEKCDTCSRCLILAKVIYINIIITIITWL